MLLLELIVEHSLPTAAQHVTLDLCCLAAGVDHAEQDNVDHRGGEPRQKDT